MSKEIFGWFEPTNEQKLKELIPALGIKSVVEIGSFLGKSAVWFAEQGCEVTCIDKFEEVEEGFSDNNMFDTLAQLGLPKDFYSKFQENVNESGYADHIKVIRGWSGEVADKAPIADLVYIDGDHTYEGCKNDIDLYLPKAKKVICGDDYIDRFPGTQKAADEIGAEHFGSFWYKVL